jgi:hypothetical protein
LPAKDRQTLAPPEAVAYAAETRGYDLDLHPPGKGQANDSWIAAMRLWYQRDNQALLLTTDALDLFVVVDSERPLLRAFAEPRPAATAATPPQARLAAFWDRFAPWRRNAADARNLLLRAPGAAASLDLLHAGCVPVAFDLDGTLVASGDGPPPPGAAAARFAGARWLKVRPGAAALLCRLRRERFELGVCTAATRAWADFVLAELEAAARAEAGAAGAGGAGGVAGAAGAAARIFDPRRVVALGDAAAAAAARGGGGAAGAREKDLAEVFPHVAPEVCLGVDDQVRCGREKGGDVERERERSSGRGGTANWSQRLSKTSRDVRVRALVRAACVLARVRSCVCLRACERWRARLRARRHAAAAQAEALAIPPL